ncbi:hypothetical protein H257_00596 [Aphanomyces astaci]|uniref:Uncharacterized protein n=1 Tax=Aphanomyces astaci TaxID=112090 RepID=W4HD60_APHAT|nr:hypothetical protein H257_00596 [Aphanomyces astaci]ETV89239.1 hypothetical protein H257_00596 [Aphanomyces astaci]|eukprot:XP_009821639.1 hypothetical protein H257_00596 [Aphanomyces astaci]
MAVQTSRLSPLATKFSTSQRYPPMHSAPARSTPPVALARSPSKAANFTRLSGPHGARDFVLLQIHLLGPVQAREGQLSNDLELTTIGSARRTPLTLTACRAWRCSPTPFPTNRAALAPWLTTPLDTEEVTAQTPPITNGISNAHTTAIVRSRWTAMGQRLAVRVGPTTTWHPKDYIKQTLPRVRAAYTRWRRSARTERASKRPCFCCRTPAKLDSEVANRPAVSGSSYATRCLVHQASTQTLQNTQAMSHHCKARSAPRPQSSAPGAPVHTTRALRP